MRVAFHFYIMSFLHVVQVSRILGVTQRLDIYTLLCSLHAPGDAPLVRLPASFTQSGIVKQPRSHHGT